MICHQLKDTMKRTEDPAMNNRSLKKCVGEQRNSYQSKIEMISVLFFGKAPNVAAGPLLAVMTDPLKSAPFSWAKPSQSAPATLFFGRIRSESCHVGRNEMAGLKDPRKGPSINENGK
jgi:hypothetical protein